MPNDFNEIKKRWADSVTEWPSFRQAVKDVDWLIEKVESQWKQITSLQDAIKAGIRTMPPIGGINTPRLCYIKDQWAFFTTQDLDNQWGDNWNDRPYEHNTGIPYRWAEHRGERYEIIRIAYRSDLETPTIWAGTPIDDFISLIHKSGGEVYLRYDLKK